MNISVLLLCVGPLLYAGCSSVSGTADAEARRHLNTAEEYEQAGLFEKAEEEYIAIVESSPQPSLYPDALRKLALLSLHPSNAAGSDSAAVARFRAYLPHAPTATERESTLLHVRLLERVLALEEELADQRVSLDSLSNSKVSLVDELAARSKRLHQVETELQQVSSELKKLREVDVQLHKRKK